MSSSPVIILLTLSDALNLIFFIIEVRVRMETSGSCAQRARYAQEVVLLVPNLNSPGIYWGQWGGGGFEFYSNTKRNNVLVQLSN